MNYVNVSFSSMGTLHTFFLFLKRWLVADPGEARGWSTNTFVNFSFIHSVSQSVSQPFAPKALRRHHAQTLRNRASSYKIVIKNILNPEGHQNPISGSNFTAILLKGWILPIGGALAGEGLPCSLRSRPV